MKARLNRARRFRDIFARFLDVPDFAAEKRESRTFLLSVASPGRVRLNAV
jgi:hypothetical protein